MASSRSLRACPSAAKPTTDRMIWALSPVSSSPPILKTFGEYRELILYPATERVSPARIAKSAPVIPKVEPPLSV